MVLAGDRCVVRPWRSRDASSLVRYANNLNVARYLRDRFPHPYTSADARAFLAMATGRNGQGTTFAIDIGGEAVGGIGILAGSDIERFSAEIGYWLGEPFWGRGAATEAVALVTGDAFARLNMLRLFALPAASNAASARVLEKAGYEREAVLRSAAVKFGQPQDQLLYARINPAWRGAESQPPV